MEKKSLFHALEKAFPEFLRREHRQRFIRETIERDNLVRDLEKVAGSVSEENQAQEV